MNLQQVVYVLRQDLPQPCGCRVWRLLNIQLGDEAADFLIKQIASKIQDGLELTQKVARISESVLGLILPGVPRGDGEAMINEMAQWVRNEPHPGPFGDLYTGCDVSALPLTFGPEAGNHLALLESQLKTLIEGCCFSSI